jgi:6-phosphogluconolactonase
MTQLTTVSDGEAAARCAAEEIARIVRDARAERGVVHVSLAGGGTPRRAYELLPGLVDDWEGVELWYGDERCVAADDPDSNHRMVSESLLAAVAARRGAPPPPPLEHRIPGELGPDEAARAYGEQLRARVAADHDGLPVLDLALLGLGEDGHTASLFPGHPEVDARDQVCLPVRGAPKPPPERVTLSLDVLRAARQCLLLATGAAKADAVAAVLAGPDPHVPASLLRAGRLRIITDEAAAPAGDRT